MNWSLALMILATGSEPIGVSLRFRQETSRGSGRFHALVRSESWNPTETAVIICDVWDTHTCENAVKRVTEFAPRLNDFVRQLRSKGVTVIHAPSDCMKYYANHPARKRAVTAPKAKELPADIKSWCRGLPSEEKAEYPLDQSDGGCDDPPQAHESWTQKLLAMGRNPKLPWIKQIDVVAIDSERDYISDQGDEVWNILTHHGINNVIIAGVHTNMCVLGRPFGLRQMAKNGKNVVLVRDLTDTMYNPNMHPFVAHHTGTDRIVEHIEKFVCPTITSNQVLGGTAFRYSTDKRPRVALVISEDEYKTERSVPAFASSELGKEFSTVVVFGSDQDGNTFPGLPAIEEADVLVVSIRRRTLQPSEIALFRNFVKSGKGVVGIRTASHAFCLRPPAKAPAGTEQWPEFDRDVFGGNYSNHFGDNDKPTIIWHVGDPKDEILAGLKGGPFQSSGSLYKVSPIVPSCRVLALGQLSTGVREPVAWTFIREDGGRSVYTSLGHEDDFKNAEFRRFLVNAIRWAAARQSNKGLAP